MGQTEKLLGKEYCPNLPGCASTQSSGVLIIFLVMEQIHHLYTTSIFVAILNERLFALLSRIFWAATRFENLPLAGFIIKT